MLYDTLDPLCAMQWALYGLLSGPKGVLGLDSHE
jgi:hypothetical protein